MSMEVGASDHLSFDGRRLFVPGFTVSEAQPGDGDVTLANGSPATPFVSSEIIKRRAFAAAMQIPPTITDTGTAAPASTTYYGASHGIFRYSNTRTYNLSGGSRDGATQVKAYGNGGTIIVPSSGTQVMKVEFDMLAQKFWFRVNMQVGTAACPFRVWVDEQPHTATYSTLGSADAANHYWLVDLGDAFGRGYHRIMVEFGDGVSVDFDGIHLLATDSAYAPQAYSSGTLVWIGDSIGQGTYATLASGSATMGGGFTHNLGYLLGLAHWYGGYSQGGTGFLQVAGDGSPKYRDRFSHDVYPVAPDAVVLETTPNDGAGGFSYAALLTEVNACITAIQANLPYAKIIICGPLDVPPNHGNAPYADWIKAPKDAATAAGLSYIDTQTVPLFTGTGNVTSPTGDGNSDYFGLATVSASNGPPHPNAEGHKHVARFLAPQLAAALKITPGDLYDLETTWVVV